MCILNPYFVYWLEPCLFCRVQEALRKIMDEKTKQMEQNFEELLKIKVSGLF